MEFEVAYDLENEQQFWDELDDILSSNSTDHEVIDNALRTYLSFTTKFREEYLQSEYDIARCSYRLTQSALFTKSKEYVRRQIVYGLLQEEDAPTLHLIAAFLLIDGRNDEETLEMMQVEGVFPRLAELIQTEEIQHDLQLHRTLLALAYEMSRIQRLSWEDLSRQSSPQLDTQLTIAKVAVNDAFVLYLFQVIEGASDDVNDPYHYPIIRVLLVLNEQYMVSSTQPTKDTHSSAPLTNRIIKALSIHGPTYKTFGCNLILLLNRESETSLQLLILKLLYLLFQSPQTAEYFYTNDLYVLLDVILRNLLDLPADSPPATALRHTYLRVLHPLLANSQLATPPHYKRGEVLRMLRLLASSGTHFAPVDDTTLRLVARCTDVPWLQPGVGEWSPTSPQATEGATVSDEGEERSSSPEKGAGQKELARRMLGMSVGGEGASESALSVVQVAEHMAKPGEQTPSRGLGT